MIIYISRRFIRSSGHVGIVFSVYFSIYLFLSQIFYIYLELILW